MNYDANFRVTGQTVNGSHAVGFGYDADGLLTQAGALGLRRDSTNGRLDADSLTVGGATQTSGYSYDAHGALSALVARRGTGGALDTLFTTSYTRDSLSRITAMVERVQGTTETVGLTYDAVGRLSTVTRNSTLTASYTYDLNGNRATKVTAGGTATAVVDDQDRLTSYGGASYQYTHNGELRRKIVGSDTTFYTYDALGNLTEVVLPDGTEIGYLIDAQNRRIGKTVNDTLVRAWLYQGQLTPVAELDGTGAVVSRFVYATGVNVPDYLLRGDSTYRLVRDHLGSVRLVVHVASGTVVQRVAYDEFGGETANTSPGWQPFGYAGGLSDAETGLVRFGARDYDPEAGRWTAKDPIGFAGGEGSLYAYAASDPINFKDVSGLEIRIEYREIALGMYHTSVRITPENQDLWRNHPLFTGRNNGRASLTLSAFSIGRMLVSEPNHPNDAVADYSGYSLKLPAWAEGCEDQVIALLIMLDRNYGDDVPYDFWPFGDYGKRHHNSNSYAHGLLLAAGFSPAPHSNAVFPNWKNPLPLKAFLP